MRTRHAVIMLFGAVLLTGCTTVGAQLATSVQRMTWTLDTKGVPSGKYVLDPEHTSLLFKISHLGYSLYVGRFNAVHATMDYDNKHPEASELVVTVDPNSVDVNNDKVEKTLTGKDYFDTDEYPQAIYFARSITIKDKRHGVLNGELTLRGVTRKLPLDVVFNGGARNALTNKYTIGFTASGMIKRSDFGMNTLVPLVGDDVYLEINAEFERTRDHR
ncbi:MAG TPA: YceI family protein [Alphaproteobacteria bacterium]|nr:YceI family protein [Alphaproteobacteria bacterium]